MLDSSVLGALRCFEAAGRLLSFTKAAESLSLTQSAVSQQIRHLEDRLGYMLFVRQPRNLKLTPKGEALFETTTRALHDIQQTIQRLGLPNAPLQVNCLPSFALQWLMPRLTEFHREQPDVSVRLKAEFQALDRQSMEADDIDVAVRYDPVRYSQMHADVLLDEFLIPVATPEYLAQHPGLSGGVSLDGVVLLHDASPWVGAAEFVEWRIWLEAFHPAWIAQLEGPQFNLSSLAISAALNHQGVAMGRTALVYDELRSGRLVDVFGKHVRAPARYMLLSRNPEDRRVTIFSSWLKAECARFDIARMELLSLGGVSRGAGYD
ncbi:LysR family transcriptional regulator [Cupriavidus sp. AcVe19-6a]|uniref:LysR family transcriptional regulator n=1 Tax=Cupriavidus sp. AcVe19-6a TaxID=2821358 RepID=UPI001AE10115|nr:LysR family transcriptional regulator [Cupriavidus sp. AcVe19-6a]MBP0637809.1 LysR family transcriptional regulator [Cupriavidus sp. AcVe19-6a]